MRRLPDSPPINMTLSHFELYVQDVMRMEEFYARHLGFVVTDRGEGIDALVFLSRNPEEHHQLVLNPRPSRPESEGSLDHISFRVGSLGSIRAIYSALMSASDTSVESVSHGTTWSIYFRDPEGNRLEVFADTPWHVSQPCRFSIDLELNDDELYEYTEEKIRNLPGFKSAEEWRKSHKVVVTDTHARDIT
jgi:catechol-2,3-dioxygenase